MDEFLAGMLDFIQSFNQLRQKLNMDENLAFLLNKADSPDERLKANQTIRIMIDMEKIGNIVQYLNKPVKIEGILLPDNMVYNEAWKIVISKIEQIETRIR